MLEWLDLNNHQWNWNAGLNTPVCSSSPLCRLSVSFCWSVGTVPGSDQSLALIHSEWSRRGDTGLCDYWTLSLYQFQSFNNSRMSCPAQGARYARSDHRGDRHMGAIDHERYLCIFHGQEYILWSKVRLAQMCWLSSKSWVWELKEILSFVKKEKKTELQKDFSNETNTRRDLSRM